MSSSLDHEVSSLAKRFIVVAPMNEVESSLLLQMNVRGELGNQSVYELMAVFEVVFVKLKKSTDLDKTEIENLRRYLENSEVALISIYKALKELGNSQLVRLIENVLNHTTG